MASNLFCISSFTFRNCSCCRSASSRHQCVSSRSLSLSLKASSRRAYRSSSTFLRASSLSFSSWTWSASAFSLISSFCRCSSRMLFIICYLVGPSRVAPLPLFILNSVYFCSFFEWGQDRILPSPTVGVNVLVQKNTR